MTSQSDAELLPCGKCYSKASIVDLLVSGRRVTRIRCKNKECDNTFDHHDRAKLIAAWNGFTNQGNKILPCPQCGTIAYLEMSSCLGSVAPFWSVICNNENCGNLTDRSNMADAINDWNRDAKSTPELTNQELIDKLKGALMMRIDPSMLTDEMLDRMKPRVEHRDQSLSLDFHLLEVDERVKIIHQGTHWRVEINKAHVRTDFQVMLDMPVSFANKALELSLAVLRNQHQTTNTPRPSTSAVFNWKRRCYRNDCDGLVQLIVTKRKDGNENQVRCAKCLASTGIYENQDEAYLAWNEIDSQVDFPRDPV